MKIVDMIVLPILLRSAKSWIFAIFQNAGYMGLYGGLDVDDIHARKGLEVFGASHVIQNFLSPRRRKVFNR